MRLADRRTERHGADGRTAFVLALTLAAGALGASLRPAAAQSGCEQAVVASPVAGTRVRGLVRVLGSAQIDRFMFYKLEWATSGDPETWFATSHVIEAPVRHGLLDRWATDGPGPGAYRLKLTVVDVDSQERCRFVVEGIVVAADGPEAMTETLTTAATPLPTAPGAAGAAASEWRPSATEAPPTPDAGGDVAAAATAVATRATRAPVVLDDAIEAPAATEEADEARPPSDERATDTPVERDPTTEPSEGDDAESVKASAAVDDARADEGTAAASPSETAAAAELADFVRRGFLLGFGVVLLLMLTAGALWARAARR